MVIVSRLTDKVRIKSNDIHTAFNPALFTVEGTNNETNIILHIVPDMFWGEDCSIKVNLTNGSRQIDLQSALRSMFYKQLENLDSQYPVITDFAQSFKYEIRLNSPTGEVLLKCTAVCAVAQIRDSHNIESDKLLTSFPNIKVYPNYPRDISLIPSTSFSWKGKQTTIDLVNRLEVECSDISFPPEVSGTVGEWVNYDWQKQTGDILQIDQENIKDIIFNAGAKLGQDNKLYFISKDHGIWSLGNEGVKQTNKTDGYFSAIASDALGGLYFCGSNETGIWYLDSSERVKPTNKTDGYFSFGALGQNDKLYFGGQGGIWYLDTDGLIKPTNVQLGVFSFGILGQDNKLYFGSYSYSGIWYLDDDGEIKQTNKQSGIFAFGVLGQDEKLYLGGSELWYLDNDGEIKYYQDIGFQFGALGKNGKLYFGGEFPRGIWHMDDDGEVKPTNKTNGHFTFAVLGPDGKLYFGGVNTGIWYLDDDGDIKPTNNIFETFSTASIAQSGKLYFGGNHGIWYLDESYTGLSLSTSINIPSEGKQYFIHTDVNPAIKEEQFQYFTTQKAEQRFQLLVDRAKQDYPDLVMSNNPIVPNDQLLRARGIPNTDLPDSLSVQCMCVPSSPFYLRWINRFGGVDYWMFQQRQTYTNKQTEITSYQPYIENYQYAFGTDLVSKITATETIIIGAQDLNSAEWEELAKICYSPKVQYYHLDKNFEEWRDVVVIESDNKLLTDQHGSIEIEIKLPTPQIQV